ncbi:MAG: acetoin utilization protein AcuC [Geodermatophilaceae bacterium]|nr:acetoin utilization protein AcuC [Geodermatophilaceae bacterium]
MSDSVAVVWDDSYLGYDMGPQHPLHPVRLDLTMRLAGSLGVLAHPNVTLMPPAYAGDELLTLVHDPAYLDAVRRAPEQSWRPGFGLGTPDNPVFQQMHEVSALIAGGSVLAARQVWERHSQHAVNIAGGLHHAMRSQASGFCVYNDAAIAIAWLLSQGAERVAYIDVDVHHGDGVQAAFYSDPRVLTVSVHESPFTLWPGTGFPEETGEGDAVGTAVNLALPAGTADGDWLRAFHAVVPSALRAFRPQVLVTQCGCDTHRDDPLANLALSVDGQRTAFAALHSLAHEVCDGRWLVLGGGGYGLVRCVPRAWTHLLAEAAGYPIDPRTPIPADWTAYVRGRALRAAPPRTMGEEANLEWQPWEPDRAQPVDLAIEATRRASFPLFGLDPDDPRD